MDTLGVMIRRVWLKKSPFSADRGHLHHLLLDAGFRVRHVVYIISSLQIIFGSIGLLNYYFGLPDSLSFFTFSTIFVGYVYLISRPWRAIHKLRTLHIFAGFTVRGSQHVYVGKLNKDSAVEDIEVLLGEYKYDYEFEIYESVKQPTEKPHVFAIIDVKETDNVKKFVKRFKKRMTNQLVERFLDDRYITIRQYVTRSSKNDRRKKNHAYRNMYKRVCDRRSSNERLIYSSI
jgi:REP element-mobilizing transposase RayT